MDDYWDEDEEDSNNPGQVNSAESGENTNGNVTPRGQTVADSEDELDTFMQGIESELKKESKHKVPKSDAPILATDKLIDGESDYLDYLQSKGIDWNSLKNNSNGVQSSDEDDGNAMRLQEEDTDERQKNKVITLQEIDHAKIEYEPFVKNINAQRENVTCMPDQQAHHLRTEDQVRVTGTSKIPSPCVNFDMFHLPPQLRQAIHFDSPSIIQSHAIPMLMSGHDVIALAETGSGKTCAYLFPLLAQIHYNLRQGGHTLSNGQGPMALVLAPTRELCFQIHSDAKKYASSLKLSTAAVYGGTDKLQQFKTLRHNIIHLLCATPGRLMDMIKMKALSLHRTTFVVLDEADRMLDFGFGPQVRTIMSQIRPDRQTALFSATFPRKVQHLADEFLCHPLRVTVGRTGQANRDIQQNVVVVQDEVDKHAWVQRHLTTFSENGNVLIFVGSIGRAIDLSTLLNEENYRVAVIHGMMDQKGRDDAVYAFKKSQLNILVATDLASRGLDIKSVKCVIEYDVAHDIDTHIHRIGRTGRAGERGTSYTLITAKQDRQAVELLKHLEQMKQPIPDDLMALAKKNKKFRGEYHGAHDAPSYSTGHQKLPNDTNGKDKVESIKASNREPIYIASNDRINAVASNQKMTFDAKRNEPPQSSSMKRPPLMKGMIQFEAATVQEKKRSRWDMKD